MIKEILVLGYFGFKNNELDGQTIKTRTIQELLSIKLGSKVGIEIFDTQKFQFSKFSFFSMLYKILGCKILVYIPAQKNLKYLFPLIYLICKLKNSQILYFVVGGWLEDFLKNKKMHVAFLSRIKAILTESNDLTNTLRFKYHFDNVKTFHNFRIHSFVPKFIKKNSPFKVVYMGRINRMKGIDYVFYLADYFSKHEINLIHIDFFGPIEKDDEEYFFNELKKYENCSFKGALDPKLIYSTLNNYDLMVFPTRYFTEGFPGSILDAYISGLPVVTTHWKHATDFVKHGINGFIVPFENSQDDFLKAVLDLYRDNELLYSMKKQSYDLSMIYSSDSAWKILSPYFNT
jgi:glycosyltransferase involved in cell wall biosynthesis